MEQTQKTNKYHEYKQRSKELSTQLSESRKEIANLKKDLASQGQINLKNDILLSKGVKVKLSPKQYWITIIAYLAGMGCLWYLIIRLCR